MLHGFLFLLLLIGPAFLHQKAPDQTFTPILEMVNVKITDGETRGGGTPAAVAQAQSQPPAAPHPQQTTQTAPREQPSPVVPRPPERPEPVEKQVPDDFSIKPPVKTTKTEPKKTEPSPDSKTKPTVNFDQVVTRRPSNNKKKEENRRSEQLSAQKSALQKAQNERAKILSGINSATTSIRQGSAGTTSVSLSGFGGGGEAFANYRDVVASVYKNKYEAVLLSAGDIAEGADSVTAKITIDKSGSVVSSRIISKSNNSGLNRLVQRVIDGITRVAPFPEGATEDKREFTITFDLKAKRQLG